jgi:Tol biopolymer transport system component
LARAEWARCISPKTWNCGIAYTDTKNGVSNIFAQPLDGGPLKQLTNFTADRIFWFEFSRDGKQIALSRGTQTSDIVLISNFKP